VQFRPAEMAQCRAEDVVRINDKRPDARPAQARTILLIVTAASWLSTAQLMPLAVLEAEAASSPQAVFET
jgi:hypothetical protein